MVFVIKTQSPHNHWIFLYTDLRSLSEKFLTDRIELKNNNEKLEMPSGYNRKIRVFLNRYPYLITSIQWIYRNII